MKIKNTVPFDVMCNFKVDGDKQNTQIVLINVNNSEKYHVMAEDIQYFPVFKLPFTEIDGPNVIFDAIILRNRLRQCSGADKDWPITDKLYARGGSVREK